MAATDLEKLVVQIEANTTKLTKDLAKLTGDMNRAATTVERRTNTMSGIITANFTRAGAALSAFFTIRAVTGFIANMIEAADKLQALSDRTGIGTDQLQKLAAAAAKANVDTGQLNDSLDTFARNVGRAAEGQGELAKVFADADIKPTGDLVDVLLKVADAVEKAKTRSEEFRITEAALGKSSEELVNLLRQGAPAIKAQMDAFKNGITPEATAALAEYAAHWKEIETSFTNMAAGPAAKVLGGFSIFLKDLETGGWRAGLQDLAAILSTDIFGNQHLEKFDLKRALQDLDPDIKRFHELRDEITKLRAQLAAEQGPAMFPADVALRKKLGEDIAAAQAELDSLGQKIAAKDVPLAVPKPEKPFGEADTGLVAVDTKAPGLDVDDEMSKLDESFAKIRDADRAFREAQFETGAALREQTARDTADRNQQELDDLAQFHADEESAWDGYYERLAEKRQADADDAAEKASHASEDKLQAASDFFGNLATLSRSKNKTLAGIGKAAAIAQATIDGIAAVQKALASPAGFPANFLLAASVGVATAVNVAKIAAAEKGGIIGPSGPMQLRRYARGGIASSTQFAMFGEGAMPEAFVPLPDGRRIPVRLQVPKIPLGMGGPSTNVFNMPIDARGAQRGVGEEIRAQLLAAAPLIVAASIRGTNKRLPDMMLKAQRRKL